MTQPIRVLLAKVGLDGHDLMSSVADGSAVSNTALTESGGRWLDGTATAKDLFLNLVVDDDASHTSGTGTFTGTVTIKTGSVLTYQVIAP